MPRKGRNFELAYGSLYELDKNKFEVISPFIMKDNITGENREVDILIKYRDKNDLPRKIYIECKDRKQIEDVTLIEQLVTKKNNLGIDYLIVTSTSSFSKCAIIKAKHYGIILEKANLINKNLICELSNNLVCDLFFLKCTFEKIFFVINKKICTFKEVIKNLNIIEQYQFITYLSFKLNMSKNPGDQIEKLKEEKEIFYSDKSNLLFNEGFEFVESDAFLKKMNISIIVYKISYKPLKVTYPFNNQISIKNTDEEPKKYKILYGDENEYLECGFVDDGNLNYKLKIKKRPFYRFVDCYFDLKTRMPNNYKFNIVSIEGVDFDNISYEMIQS